MTEIRLALTGFGNVGRAVAQLLAENGQEYRRRYGVDLLLTGVADRGGAAVSPTGLGPGDLLRAKDERGTVAAVEGGRAGLAGDEFLDLSDAQVLLEAASTNFDNAEPGMGYARGALQRGMDVVLASKGALVLDFDGLMEVAESSGRRILYSATTGAPLPILEMADRVLVGVRIERVEGIVNATANQILSTMAEGASYDEGVRAAQQAGVAETDPTLDVDGWDAAAKAVIIGRSLFGGPLGLDDVRREGIRGLRSADLQAASAAGETYKLIARLVRDGDHVRAEVAPERRAAGDVLGSLRGTEMGVVFHTDLLGEMACTVKGGHGGGISTALTVLRDVVNLARERGWAR